MISNFLYQMLVQNKEALATEVMYITSNSSNLDSSAITLISTIIQDLTYAAIEQPEVKIPAY